MGLDMYLYARKHEYSSSFYKTKKTKLTPAYPADIVKVFPEFSQESVDALPEDERSFRDRRAVKRNTYYEIGYWRKANHIHNWFVENVQGGVDDCRYYEVTKEQLEDLLETCRIVKNATQAIAKKLLPTAEGFFFGDTDYDEWYFKDIETTIAIIKKVLAETDFDHEIVVYTSSW